MSIIDYLYSQKPKNTRVFQAMKSLALIAGVGSSLGLYSQALKIWLEHSSGSVSFNTYLLWIFINLIYGIYMLMEDNKVGLITAIANLSGCVLVMVFIIAY